MNEEILEKFHKHLRGKYHKQSSIDNNYKFAKQLLDWIKKEKGKTYKDITKDDITDYKIYCLETFKINGNVARLNSVNNFLVKYLERPELRVTVPRAVRVNKPVLSEKEIEKYKQAAKTPLEKLIVTYQIDGLLRPHEFAKLRISLHDKENQIVYLNETKTGDNYVIFTPNMIEAYEVYLRTRVRPKYIDDYDYLIIIEKGSHYGKPIKTKRSDFIWRQTKKIAVRAGFKRSIYPYLIKPSAITNGFNNKINPRILQRQARHSRIETTLLYDHTSDEMVKEYFNKTQRNQNIDNLEPEDKAKVWFDKLLSGEIDLKTFKTGLDVLLPKRKIDGDIGYA